MPTELRASLVQLLMVDSKLHRWRCDHDATRRANGVVFGRQQREGRLMVRLMVRHLGEAEPLVLLVRDAAATPLLPARVVFGRLAATALDRLQELEREAQRLVEPSEICGGTGKQMQSHD